MNFDTRTVGVNKYYLLIASNSPVSPHLQQNGFSNSSSTVVAANSSGTVSGTQPTPTMGQVFTGAGGTWTGSNTLTYTQSMQPPDNRNHHSAYCKLFVQLAKALV